MISEKSILKKKPRLEKVWFLFIILIYNEIEVGATIGICLEKEKSMENPYSFKVFYTLINLII